MVKVHVSKVEWCPNYGSDVVVLREIDGERCSSIAVREWEAQLIGVLLNQHSQEPHKTAWLLSYLLENLDIKILRVELQKSFRGEISAQVIYCHRNTSAAITHSPGEAIELAMRSRAAMLVPESFLNISHPGDQQSSGQELEIKRLKAELEKTVEMENYEKAARLRDKIVTLEKAKSRKNAQ